jgi:hypothetical protein
MPDVPGEIDELPMRSTSQPAEKMLWKTIDVKAAAGSKDVRNCETSCRFKFPAAGNFAGNFSLMKPENLKLCPKSAKLAAPPGNYQGIQEVSR